MVRLRLILLEGLLVLASFFRSSFLILLNIIVISSSLLRPRDFGLFLLRACTLAWVVRLLARRFIAVNVPVALTID